MFRLLNSSEWNWYWSLKKWRPEHEDAQFNLEDGKYIVGREVEKCLN